MTQQQSASPAALKMTLTEREDFKAVSLTLLQERDQALAEALSIQSVALMTAGPGEGALSASLKALGPGAVEIDVDGALSYGSRALDEAVQRAIAAKAPVAFSSVPSFAQGGAAAMIAVRQAADAVVAAGLKAVIISRDPMSDYAIDAPAQAPALTQNLAQRREAMEADRLSRQGPPGAGLKG